MLKVIPDRGGGGGGFHHIKRMGVLVVPFRS